VSDTDLLADAVAELYSSDPDQFVERRGALAAAARAAGQAPVARQIAALRKPTRSAWVVNRLALAEPGVTSELTSLGDELRAAQESLDGAAITELSRQRRRLIETLARRAFEVAGQPQPPAALRDEVTATLGAALADPEVAGQVAAGTLIRPARSEGFGPAGPAGLGGPPELALVTSSGARGTGRTPRASGPGRTPTGTQSRAQTPAQTRTRRSERAQPAGPSPAGPSAAEQARAERERRRQADLAAAERAAEEAARTAEAATAAELDLERTVQTLEEQLADARSSLADTRNQARRARNRQRQTSQALDRLRG
jgi:hypothetical protein